MSEKFDFDSAGGQQEIDLGNLTDQQNMWLTQLSYLDIADGGREAASNGGITLCELRNHLANPDAPFCGDLILSERGFDKASNGVIGDSVPSDGQLLDQLIDLGLGSLKITNISTEQKMLDSGLQALTFEDTQGNVGISFRGTDLDLSRAATRDMLEADFLEYFTGTSTQANQASSYFEQNKSNDGNNYLYGHSLGGNLVSHVFVNKYDEIQQAFTINANPINQKLINTPEKVAAFNDPEKYKFNAICGDLVSNLKNTDAYQNNINYIQNNKSLSNNFVGSHLVQSAEFDQDGRFVETTKAEMDKSLGFGTTMFIKMSQGVREGLNRVGDGLEKVEDYFRGVIDDIGQVASQYSAKAVELFNEYKGGFMQHFQELRHNVQEQSLNKDLEQDINLDELVDIEIDSLFDKDITELCGVHTLDGLDGHIPGQDEISLDFDVDGQVMGSISDAMGDILEMERDM